MLVLEIFDTRIPAGERRFVEHYDPEALNGAGLFSWTNDIREAKPFPDFTTAFEFWRQQSKTRPLRDDGKPNRPLTAKTVAIVDQKP